ncbi:MAG: CPBP family intramembrane metalloprotease [Bryobacteraceae bacterium]|nr:CPBP family intramembrane metalloprotease [Bryobacteraceae bacterium]
MTSRRLLLQMPIARTAEFAFLFFVVPSVIAWGRIGASPLLLLIPITLGAWLALRRDAAFVGHPFRLPDSSPWLVMLWRFMGVACALAAGVAWWKPSLLFDLIRERPLLWAALMVLYPLLSVLPQEFLFRTFFFHRYRALFGEGAGIVLASALAFGFVHIVFGNWLAVVLSFGGGLIFAASYRANPSLPLVWIEHAVFGNFIFTIGLGRYFTSS